MLDVVLWYLFGFLGYAAGAAVDVVLYVLAFAVGSSPWFRSNGGLIAASLVYGLVRAAVLPVVLHGAMMDEWWLATLAAASVFALAAAGLRWYWRRATA